MQLVDPKAGSCGIKRTHLKCIANKYSEKELKVTWGPEHIPWYDKCQIERGTNETIVEDDDTSYCASYGSIEDVPDHLWKA